MPFMIFSIRSKTKIVQTRVTFHALVKAQGGFDPCHDSSLIWVQCPVDYEESEITADDIVNDGAIVVCSEKN